MRAKRRLERLEKLSEYPKRMMVRSEIQNQTDQAQYDASEKDYQQRLRRWIQQLSMLLSFNGNFAAEVQKAGAIILEDETREAAGQAAEMLATVVSQAKRDLQAEIEESERIESQAAGHHREEIEVLRKSYYVAMIGAGISVLAMFAAWGSVWYSREQTKAAIDSAVASAIQKVNTQSQPIGNSPSQSPSLTPIPTRAPPKATSTPIPASPESSLAPPIKPAKP